MTVQCLEKCFLSDAVNGTDDMLWNYNEEDGDVKSKYKDDKGTDCEDSDGDTDR
jgi:hypothetical protein